MPNKNQILVHSPAGIRKKCNSLIEKLLANEITVEQATTARDLLKIASDALMMQEKRNKPRTGSDPATEGLIADNKQGKKP